MAEPISEFGEEVDRLLKSHGLSYGQAAMRRIDAEMAGYAPVAVPPPAGAARHIAKAWPLLALGERNAALRFLVDKATIERRAVVLHLADLGWDNWPATITVDRRGNGVRVD